MRFSLFFMVFTDPQLHLTVETAGTAGTARTAGTAGTASTRGSRLEPEPQELHKLLDPEPQEHQEPHELLDPEPLEPPELQSKKAGIARS